MNILMPQLGETVDEGRISTWYKSVGDRVVPGDNLFEIETDKVSMEVPATAAGILTEIRIGAGETAPVGAIVATLGEALGNVAAGAPALLALSTGTPFSEVRTPARNFGSARQRSGVLATPYARRLAVELDTSLSVVHGSGPGRRIVGGDVLARAAQDQASAPSPAPAHGYIERPVEGMRAAIARRLTESKRTIPHFHLTMDIDATGLERRRGAHNAAGGPDRVSINDMLIEAWSAALRGVPTANAIWAEDCIRQFRHVDVGFAVALLNGLFTPVIPYVDTLSIREIASATTNLAQRARDRKLKQNELEGGVSTISNLGMYGVREFAGIINPPQSTLLAVGALQRRPVEGPDGAVRFAPRMTVTLACDHRVIDGALGARLLNVFREHVERPG